MAQKTRNHGTQILLHTGHARDPATSTTPATVPPFSIPHSHLAQSLLHQHSASTSTQHSHLPLLSPPSYRAPNNHMEACLQSLNRDPLLRLQSPAHLRRISLKPDTGQIILHLQTIHKMRKYMAAETITFSAPNCLVPQPTSSSPRTPGTLRRARYIHRPLQADATTRLGPA